MNADDIADDHTISDYDEQNISMLYYKVTVGNAIINKLRDLKRRAKRSSFKRLEFVNLCKLLFIEQFEEFYFIMLYLLM